MLDENILAELEKEKEFLKQSQEQPQEDIEISYKEEPNNNLPTNNATQMSEGQARALLDTIKNPKEALGVKLGEEIAKQVSSGVGKERLKKTADTVIDSGLTTFETDAETQKNKATKNADEVYFETHKAELTRGGISKRTYRDKMVQVVATDKVWSDINFYLFTWWVVGINNFFSTISSFNWFFKILIGTIFTLPYLAFIPIAFSIGVVRCLIYFINILYVKIVDKFKKNKQVQEPKELNETDNEENLEEIEGDDYEIFD